MKLAWDVQPGRRTRLSGNLIKTPKVTVATYHLWFWQDPFTADPFIVLYCPFHDPQSPFCCRVQPESQPSFKKTMFLVLRCVIYRQVRKCKPHGNWWQDNKVCKEPETGSDRYKMSSYLIQGYTQWDLTFSCDSTKPNIYYRKSISNY